VGDRTGQQTDQKQIFTEQLIGALTAAWRDPAAASGRT
jgi:hypothetical protein